MARKKADSPGARTQRVSAGMEEQMDAIAERLAEARKAERDPAMQAVWDEDIAFLEDERKALDRIVRVMRYTELRLETNAMKAALREERKVRRKAAEPEPTPAATPPNPSFNLNTSGA